MSVFMPPDRAGELQLSDAFLSFLRGCLCFETEDRMTAQDMLKHPFLQVKYDLFFFQDFFVALVPSFFLPVSFLEGKPLGFEVFELLSRT